MNTDGGGGGGPGRGGPGRGGRRAMCVRSLTGAHLACITAFMAAGASASTAALRSVLTLVVAAVLLTFGAKRGPVPWNLARFAVGVGGVVAGVGAGLHHVVVAPASAVAITGVAVLVTGLLTVVHAGLALVGPLRVRHRLWVVPVAGVVTTTLSMPLALAVFVTNAPDFPLGTVTPADRGLVYEEVSVEADDGVQLEAWYIPSSNGAAVVLLGGCCSARDSQVDNAAVLAAHGYGVLLLDTRGHGGSGGDPMLWGWWGEADVRAAVHFLVERPDVIDGRVGAIGFSVGGEQALAAAGADERILAVVVEGVSARGARDEGDPARGVQGALLRYVDWVSRNAAAVMTDAPTPTKLRDAVGAFSEDQRLLVIAAGQVEAEIVAANLLRSRAPQLVDVWVVDGARHVEARTADPVEWEQRVTDFFDRELGPR